MNVAQRDRRQLYLPAFAMLGVVVVTVVLLKLQGRLWICECGRIDLWSGNTQSADNSQHLLDPYSFTHVLHGVAFYGLVAWLLPRLSLAWKLLIVVTLEAVWEVIENTEYVIQRYREATLALGYAGDTVVNVLGDLACCVFGFFIARRLGLWRSVLLFIITELILIAWIRDSLILNIIMLLFPFDALRNWQLGR
jgi:hypothetical protein